MSNWINTYKEADRLVDAHFLNKKADIKKPNGYTESTFKDLDNGVFKPIRKHELKRLKVEKRSKIQNYELQDYKKKKLWELATSPGKSILMNIGMSYMSPNDIQVIPIMMLFMLFINSFKEMLSVNSKFAALDTSIDADVDSYDIVIMKSVFLISCCGNLAVGIWKLNNMGLIPNKPSDWLSFETKLLSEELFI